MSFRSTRWFLGMAVGGAIALGANSALAQITPDKTLPNNSNVTVNGNTFNITGGTTAGRNLFHSFQQFSVPTGSTAYFNNAADIQNIFGRVTGGVGSYIDGLIRANGTANLFLINPSGIIFGPNASLNIGASFVGSTASSLKFADGFEFNATAPSDTPLLTVSVPIGLQFGANPGSIQVQGDGQGIRTTSELIDTTSGLRVQPNQTLALVGGDISLEGATLKTAGGRIELGSVAGVGLVRLTPVSKGFALGYDAVPNFAQIQLSQQAAVDASGAGSGDIQVAGRRVTLSNSSQIETSTLGAESGGAMVIKATESVEVLDPSSGLFTNTYPSATGNTGDLTINTGKLVIQDGASVSSNTLQGATGDAGDLTVRTNTLLVQDGAAVTVQSFGTGTAGNMTLNARSIYLDKNASLTANTQSAKVDLNMEQATININSRDLIVRRGSNIRTNATGENVLGGNININSDIIAALENSDISANSANYRGGKVKITTQGIFGTQSRDAPTSKSDITATWGSPELSGKVLSRVFVNLPSVPIDTKVAQGCTAGGAQDQSEFIITGRGGLPPNPGDSLSTDAVDVGLVTLSRGSDNRKSPSVSTQPKKPTPKPIVEATGWVINSFGEVELTADAATIPHDSWHNSISCRTSS